MVHVPAADGRWVDENYARLAEIIHDYDPTLELRWIPPELRTEEVDKQRPYVVWDTKSNSPVLYATELEPPVAVLERVFKADNAKQNVLKDLELHNAAVQAFQYKEWLEKLEEAHDFSRFVVSNKKHYWKHDGIKYDNEMRKIG